MEQKDLDKYTPGFKKCLVDRGYEIALAFRQKDISLGQKLLLHIVQHTTFRSLDEYELTMNELTDSQVEHMINNMKKNCPFLVATDLTLVVGRLPIRIGRWIVGSTDYVSS